MLANEAVARTCSKGKMRVCICVEMPELHHSLTPLNVRKAAILAAQAEEG